MGQGAEETPPESSRPEWLPEKFTDEQALLDSYGELERKLSAQGQQMSEMESVIERLIEQGMDEPDEQESYTAPPQTPMELLEQYEQALADGDGRTAAAISIAMNQSMIAQGLAPIMQRLDQMSEPQDTTKEDMFFAKLVEEEAIKVVGDDYEDIKKDMAQMIRDNPHLLPDSDDPVEVAQAMKTVADAVRYRGGTPTRDNSNDNRMAKIQAQTLRGRGSTPESSTEWKDIIKERLSGVSGYNYR